MKPISPMTKISWSLLLLLSLFTALDALAIDIYLPAFPALAESFATTPGHVQLTLSIFLIGLAIGQGIYGPLLDRFGRRRPLLIGIAIFILGSLLAAIAPTIEWLLAARFLQAIGASAGLVVPRAIISDVCDAKTSAKNFSILMQVMMIVPIIAPLFGSLILRFGSWHLIFYTLAILGSILWLWGSQAIPETLKPQYRQPLQFTAIKTSYQTLALNQVFMAYTLAGGFILGGFFVYLSQSPFIFIQHYHIHNESFSTLFAANAVGLIIFGQVSILLLKRWSAQQLLVLGMSIFCGASLVLMLSAYFYDLGLWQYILLLGLAIWSTGFIFGNLTALTMQQSPQHLTGAASSLMGLLQYAFASLIGLIVSFFELNISLLPASLFICGGIALGLCIYATFGQRSTIPITVAE
ncbi:Bcr/CflA family efflux MFS transporter [Acinetobacter haemolyticus]|uniref:multidrug effflux MFS transporter n=1 Tax=Acinetobacter haemolyticus TaxID=29430 RepID=UPI000C2B70A5|nr:multidrug effflux MFS transporter [Acinetobacter haemolyticus]ATZ67229.1 Bcr/CflA family drug resistance efflux transporter [Acinetobacter haemolyticus]NAR18152.1 Bcr/CflA family efflux MFS transporter [Acinetobacter haemolyticus]NAR29261.1 Bcr/CflA family efflux MFS transporter [Acinetobacter haemolyticus]NAR46572.1 Bcr/CflA family efflux MFS transporter [Acinetobacter haemolyticus]NAR63373.1 Bcr/CflA family efflux MFS transporter [Acinetobacter haemolyticus]